MTFWQGLAISILANTTDVAGEDQDEWARSAQNFLICLEMLLFSIAHFYTFPTDEWEDGYRAVHENSKFGDSIALGDFFSDLKLLLKTNKRKKRKRKNKSVDRLPTIEDGAEHYGEDDTVKSSASMMSQVSEGDELNVQAIEAILKRRGSDPEVAHLTERMLQNKIFIDADTGEGDDSITSWDQHADLLAEAKGEEQSEGGEAAQDAAIEASGISRVESDAAARAHALHIAAKISSCKSLSTGSLAQSEMSSDSNNGVESPNMVSGKVPDGVWNDIVKTEDDQVGGTLDDRVNAQQLDCGELSEVGTDDDEPVVGLCSDAAAEQAQPKNGEHPPTERTGLLTAMSVPSLMSPSGDQNHVRNASMDENLLLRPSIFTEISKLQDDKQQPKEDV